MFLRNLLLDEKNELHNRSMHISRRFEETDFESGKTDIRNEEADIESQKVVESQIFFRKTLKKQE